MPPLVLLPLVFKRINFLIIESTLTPSLEDGSLGCFFKNKGEFFDFFEVGDPFELEDDDKELFFEDNEVDNILVNFDLVIKFDGEPPLVKDDDTELAG